MRDSKDFPKLWGNAQDCFGRGQMRRTNGFLVVALVGVIGAGVTSAARIRQLPGTVYRVGAQEMVFSPNGRWLVGVGVSGRALRWGLSVMSVNRATGALHRIHDSPFALGGGACGLAISPDGRLLALGGRRRTLMFSMNRRTGALRQVAQSSAGAGDIAIAFSPRGTFVAVASQNFEVDMLAVNRRTGALRLASRWISPSNQELQGDQGTIAFNPRGNLLAVSTYDGVSVLSVGRRGRLTLRSHQTIVGPDDLGPEGVAFSPSGLLAVADFDYDTIVMLRVNQRTGRLRLVPGPRFRTGASPDDLAFSPDGKLLAVENGDGNGMSIATVDERTGHLRPVPGSPFGTDIGTGPGSALSLAFSPRGGLLAFGVEQRIGESITMFSTRLRDSAHDQDRD